MPGASDVSLALEAKGLCKSFGGARVVDDVDLAVPEGSIVGFLGPNGAGKTTVMSILAGLQKSDFGSVSLFGVANGQARRALRKRLGFMQEKPRVYPDMNAQDYLHFFAGLYGVPDRQKRAEELLELLGLGQVGRRPLGTFSRGMQQRVCLARVLLPDPDILMLDEPTLGLDPLGVREMREIFIELNARGKTLFFSSHQLAEMERVCDRVVMMQSGRIIAAGRQEELLPDWSTADEFEVELSASSEAIPTKVRALPEVSNVRTGPRGMLSVRMKEGTADRANLSRALTAAGLTVLSVTQARKSLEDVFFDLTSGRVPALEVSD